jgi:signal transduction histidine kinase
MSPRCWWRVCWFWLVVGLAHAVLPAQAQAPTLVFQAAQAEVTVQGQTTLKQVRLPYLWDREQPAQSGLVVFEIPFSFTRPPVEPYGLTIPKISNGYVVYLNDVMLDRFGDLTRHDRTDAKLPRLIAVPPGALQATNVLRLAVGADVGRQGGLSALTLAPMETARVAYTSVWRWRVLGPQMVAIFSALVGLIGLLLWMTQPSVQADGRVGRDVVYLYGSLAEFCWVFRVADSLMESPPLPLPWWSVMSALSLWGWSSLTVLFCIEVVGWGQSRRLSGMRLWLGVLGLLGLAAAVAARVYGWPLALTVWYGLLGLTFLLFSLVVVWQALQRGATLDGRLLAFAILVNVLIGLLDLYQLRVSPSMGGRTSLYYSSILFGLAAGLIVLRRFSAVSRHAQHLMSNLNGLVQQKEQELAISYQKLEHVAREQARSGERSRILRDMHDGVGSHISTAIRQLQSGRASGDEVLQTLRDSLDQLKLSIDAIHLPPGDVTALLANLRYRLEPRLRACGIELDWAVEALAPVAALDAGAMRQLQFMLFEAIANVMQHARASQLRIEARQVGPGVQVQVVDNGCGFDTSQVPRRGLRLMQERAQTIGARLTVGSQPGLTSLAITLPVGPANGRLL